MSRDFPQTIAAARKAFDTGELSARELVEHALHQIEMWEPHIHAFLEVLADEARQQAHTIDEQKARREPLGPLAGVPLAIKDIICTTEGHTTAASRILEHYQAPYEATVIERLKKAGAIIIGKTNLDEFAMGSSTEYSAYGLTKNPWDKTRVAGGSSGGSAAAVATDEVYGALGTDTGGSIRQPASFCGVVGVRPTYGRVSRFGAIAYGSSLDQIGTFARTIYDAALLLEVIAGQDRRDATSSPTPIPAYTKTLGHDINTIRIGIPKEFFTEEVAEGVKRTVKEAIQQLKLKGAVVKQISLPLTRAAVAVYFILVKSEASTNLARYDALRYASHDKITATLGEHYMTARGNGFGPEVKRAILMGTYALSAGYYDAWYKQANKVRTMIRQEYEQAFRAVDVIAAPVAPEVAFTIGSKANNPLAMYLSDALTVSLSVAGLPALSVPCGLLEGLPVGLQLAAPQFQEERLFQVAYAYEQSQKWWKKRPVIA